MLAKTSEPTERDIALDYIGTYTVDKARAFGSRSSAASDILHQVSGLSVLLAKACHDADRINRDPGTDECEPALFHSTFPVFMARTFEAIGTLTNLALLLEDVRS